MRIRLSIIRIDSSMVRAGVRRKRLVIILTDHFLEERFIDTKLPHYFSDQLHLILLH